jgi:glycolate oxidase FAD binding subunit
MEQIVKNILVIMFKAAKTLDLSNLNGVIEYLPEELYIKVLAGTPIKIIEDLLEKHNQQLAFETFRFWLY